MRMKRGRRVTLRLVSANWNRSELRSVEQPVRHEDVAYLAEVRKQVKTPVVLDESLCGEIDAERAAKKRLVRFLQHPPLEVRRVYSERAARASSQNNTTSAINSAVRWAKRRFSPLPDGTSQQVWPTSAIWKAVTTGIWWEALSTEDLTFRRNGVAPALVRTGLGFTLDPLRLEWLTQRKETLLG